MVRSLADRAFQPRSAGRGFAGAKKTTADYKYEELRKQVENQDQKLNLILQKLEEGPGAAGAAKKGGPEDLAKDRDEVKNEDQDLGDERAAGINEQLSSQFDSMRVGLVEELSRLDTFANMKYTLDELMSEVKSLKKEKEEGAPKLEKAGSKARLMRLASGQSLASAADKPRGAGGWFS